MQAVDTDDTRPAARLDHGRVTIVLGGGWKLGGAFHAGVLLALRESWGFDARDADELIGTSSGAITAGLIAAGMGPLDLFRRETGATLSDEGRSILARLDPATSGCEDDGPAAAVAVSQVRPRKMAPRSVGLSPRGVVTALLPRGTGSMERLAGYFDCLVGGSWPGGLDLRLCAVDVGTGRRVALDRHSGASVGQAIAASCAVPGVSHPVPIRDREYVDGAVYSVNNADLATLDGGDAEVAGDHRSGDRRTGHTVIVSAPLSVSRLHLGFGPIWLLRNAMHLQTAAELRRLGDVDRLVLVEPTSVDVATMGTNLNADHRRGPVAKAAFATAFDRLAPLAVPGDLS